jgi:hypothetical protein
VRTGAADRRSARAQADEARCKAGEGCHTDLRGQAPRWRPDRLKLWGGRRGSRAWIRRHTAELHDGAGGHVAWRCALSQPGAPVSDAPPVTEGRRAGRVQTEREDTAGQ